MPYRYADSYASECERAFSNHPVRCYVAKEISFDIFIEVLPQYRLYPTNLVRASI